MSSSDLWWYLLFPILIGLIIVIIIGCCLKDYSAGRDPNLAAFVGQGNSSNISDETKFNILNNMLDQWEFRDERFWNAISKLFYAILLLIVLPVLSGVFNEKIHLKILNFLNVNSNLSHVPFIILAIVYLCIGIIYSARILTVKRTYDYMLENIFNFNRVTNANIVKKQYGKNQTEIEFIYEGIKGFLDLPVNYGLVFIYYCILILAQYFVIVIIQYPIQ